MFGRIRFSVALLLIMALWTPAFAVDVPLEHPVYQFLARLEARGFLSEPLSASLPYSRRSVAHYLVEIQSQDARLNTVEGRQLAYFRFQFDDNHRSHSERDYLPAWENLPEQFPLKPFALYHNRRDLLEAQGNRWAFWMNPVFDIHRKFIKPENDSNGEVRVWASGVEFRGFTGNLGFFVRATDAHIRGDTQFADSNRYPYRAGSGNDGFDFDETDAFVTYQAPHVELLFGKTRNRWGNAQSSVLGLSNLPTSYTQFRTRFRFGPAELTALQAKLYQNPPVVSETDTTADGIARRQYADKYLAAHRLQFNLCSRLQIGFYESIVYGERGFDVDYLNPLMFLRSAEHYNGDRDNALMGGDFKWRAFYNTFIYGELLIDDIRTTKLGTGWYGNKLAYLGGLRLYDPVGLPNVCTTVEYCRIEPYVYSHKYPINSYQHHGTLLGHSSGPNSDAFFASLRWTVSRGFEMEWWSRHRRHGANPLSGRNVGGDFRRPARPDDSDHVSFLDGDLEKDQTWAIRFELELMYDLHLMGEIEYSSRSTKDEIRPEESSEEWRQRVSISWHPW